jgi:hypothetical protein
MRKSKSSEVRTVCILVMVAFDFFQEEGFGGEPFLFFKGSTSSPCFYSTSLSSNSSPSPPFSSDMEAFFTDTLSNSWTSLVFFVLLGLGVSCAIFGLSMSRYLHRVCWNKEVRRPVLCDLLQVLLCQLIVGLKLFLVFIRAQL